MESPVLSHQKHNEWVEGFKNPVYTYDNSEKRFLVMPLDWHPKFLPNVTKKIV